MKHRILTACITACLSAPAYAPAFASDIDQHLIQFAANNTEFHDMVETTAKKIYLQQGYGCPQIRQIARQLPKNLGNLTFPPPPVQDAGAPPVFPAPIGGLWMEHVKLVACNKTHQINLLAIGRLPADAPAPLLLAAMPGNTHVDPSIYSQAARAGANAITRSDTDDDCNKTPIPQDTRFIGYMAADRKTMSTTDTQNGWFEEWDYQFCKTPVTVQMAFLPTESGGNTINARIKTQAIKTNTPPQQPEQKPETD